MAEAGRRASSDNRGGIAWVAETDGPDLASLVRVAVPFDWAASKNAVWRTGRGGHIYARKESSTFREALAARIKDAGTSWYQGKVWVDIYVEKPNHRGDAINVVDLVCDAVKDAIGVDDNWYSLRRVDWSIVKENPMIYVGVGQEVQEDHQACSYCGQVLALSEFGSNKSTKTGRARVCRDCSAPKRGRRRPDAKEAA
jgi:Holliday junction resolvase RusA-like endonuclease